MKLQLMGGPALYDPVQNCSGQEIPIPRIQYCPDTIQHALSAW